MAGPLRVRVLGPLEVTVGGTAIGPEGSHRRSLFAILVVRANEVVSVDDLVDGLWGDLPPRSATGVVQTYVSTWRRALEDAGAAGGNHVATLDKAYRLDLGRRHVPARARIDPLGGASSPRPTLC